MESSKHIPRETSSTLFVDSEFPGANRALSPPKPGVANDLQGSWHPLLPGAILRIHLAGCAAWAAQIYANAAHIDYQELERGTGIWQEW